MATLTHAEMHQEHTAWKSERQLWCDEMEYWGREVERVLAELTAVASALREHRDDVQTQCESVKLLEEGPSGHEHELAEFERGETNPELIAMAQKHQEAAHGHQRAKMAYETLKGRHHKLMARWNQLSKAASETHCSSCRE